MIVYLPFNASLKSCNRICIISILLLIFLFVPNLLVCGRIQTSIYIGNGVFGLNNSNKYNSNNASDYLDNRLANNQSINPFALNDVRNFGITDAASASVLLDYGIFDSFFSISLMSSFNGGVLRFLDEKVPKYTFSSSSFLLGLSISPKIKKLMLYGGFGIGIAMNSCVDHPYGDLLQGRKDFFALNINKFFGTKANSGLSVSNRLSDLVSKINGFTFSAQARAGIGFEVEEGVFIGIGYSFFTVAPVLDLAAFKLISAYDAFALDNNVKLLPKDIKGLNLNSIESSDFIRFLHLIELSLRVAF